MGTNLEVSTQNVKAKIKEAQAKFPANATFQVIPINLNESAAVSYAITFKAKDSGDFLDENLTNIATTKILPPLQALPGVLKVLLQGISVPPPSATNPIAKYIESNFTATKIRINQKDALAIKIIKRSDANTLEVVDLVETAIQKLRSQLPDLEISLASSQAEYIKEATSATIDSLILAVILSIVIIFPFLRDWRATLISALAIPISLLGTSIAMAILGFNLETITLLALALVIGIVVDDAIVDVENISRHLDLGESPFKAAISATNEIGLTVSAATLTIAAVFLPVGLMSGTLGQFFKPFGITVAVAVLISLAVSRTLSPLLAAYWLKGKPWKELEVPTKTNSTYEKILIWALCHRWLVVFVSILIFGLGVGLIPFVPKAFIPKLDRGEFNITYTAPNIGFPSSSDVNALNPNALNPNALNLTAPNPLNLAALNPLTSSRMIAKKLEAEILKSPEVETVFTTIGNGQGQPHKGNLYIKLRSERKFTTAAIQDQIRALLPVISGVTTSIEDIQFVDTGGEKPLQIALVDAKNNADANKNADATRNNEPNKNENLVNLRKTAVLIKAKIKSQAGLEDIKILGDLEIEHLNSRRVVYITANLDKNIALGTATDQVVAIAKPLLPADVTIDLGGDSGRLESVLSGFASTLGLSIICIAVVLLMLFGNAVDPLLVVMSLPLALVGAIAALIATKSDFGMIAVIGIILLFGIANKNAILIVDYINQSRKRGLPLQAAILAACPIRLRPILMTTACTLLGMLPIALGIGAGSELRAPMAIAVMGGLITSTLLSLIFVPVVYSLAEVIRGRSFGDKFMPKNQSKNSPKTKSKTKSKNAPDEIS